MTYLLLNSVYVAVAVLVALGSALVLVRRVSLVDYRHVRRYLSASIGAALMVFALTALFDNVMIGLGLFSYDPNRISGLHIGAAPIEDFAYPLAAVILLPALWAVLGTKRMKSTQPQPASSDSRGSRAESGVADV